MKIGTDKLKCPVCGLKDHLGLINPLLCVTALKEEVRRLNAELVYANMLLEVVERAQDGEPVSDFELSFPVVMKARDFYIMIYGSEKR